jgi:DNA polymerase III subunit epsilon
MRQIFFDTETTGLDPAQGHRVVEIGCVTLDGRAVGERRFHSYLNPERESDPEALKVHQLSTQFLSSQPKFADVVHDFLAFVEGAEVLAHNAAFDVRMIDAELARCAKILGGRIKLSDYCQITDTLTLARERFPGQRNGLDALCKRLEVDNSTRTAHGALLDAGLLAEVYLAMTRGQDALSFSAEVLDSPAQRTEQVAQFSITLVRKLANADELAQHRLRLQVLDKQSKGQCVWLQQEPHVELA